MFSKIIHHLPKLWFVFTLAVMAFIFFLPQIVIAADAAFLLLSVYLFTAFLVNLSPYISRSKNLSIEGVLIIGLSFLSALFCLASCVFIMWKFDATQVLNMDKVGVLPLIFCGMVAIASVFNVRHIKAT